MIDLYVQQTGLSAVGNFTGVPVPRYSQEELERLAFNFTGKEEFYQKVMSSSLGIVSC